VATTTASSHSAQHSPDRSRQNPAGWSARPGYNFSEALKRLDIVWTLETVSRLFEIGPSAYTPGTKMPEQRIGSAQDLAALVQFLERATKRSMLGRICGDCSTTNTLTWTRRVLFFLTIAFAIAGSTFASEVMREIRALARSGLGVLFTTYDPNHALRAADRAYLLQHP
jgi:hypothetical protein